ncbi:MAG: MgtC/SapB family protein [Candidatus Bathyarchaeia archaeon]|nr:MgtC/SapB family protein [Candidatus Bathyarchaeota archaeon]
MSLIDQIIRLILAVILGLAIGFERERAHKPAGLRTHMLVCLGSCLFTIVSLRFSLDPARIAAGIVAGIGFIGAGAIIAEREKIVGITTAASLWVTSAIGLALGIGDYILAVIAAALTVLILFSRTIFKKEIS